MAKFLVMEIQMQDDDDVNDDKVQEGMVDAIMTIEAVQSARVIDAITT